METATQPAKSTNKQMIRRERGMFSASDDSAMMKQIQATHSPDGRELEIKPILYVIETILHHVSPGIDGVINVKCPSLFLFSITQAKTFSFVVCCNFFSCHV